MKLSSAISIVVVVVLLCGHLPSSSCENILFYFGVTGFSHVHSAYPLIEGMADKGHNVTLMTPFPTKRKSHPNITTIVSNELLQLFAPTWDEDADLIRDRLTNNQADFWNTLIPASIAACDIVLTSSTTSGMVYNSHFDLVVHDSALNECAVGLARYKYKAPYIAYSAVSLVAWYYDVYGLPLETSVVSDMEFADASPLTLYQKLKSTLNSIKWTYIRNREYYPALETMLQEKLSLGELPSLAEANADTSLVFMNTYHTTEHARALPPLFIPIAGMQINEKASPLPKDIQEFLDQPTGHDYLGFVYVSFGTAVRISKSNAEVRRKLFNAMGNSTLLKFIWKWEGEIPDNAPSNIYFANWLPQQDLFAHKDVKAVIGHGGINGIHEAIYFGIPMLIFPIFADQDFNTDSVHSKGLGIKMEFRTFTQLELENALTEVVTNQKLRANVKFASNQFRDRPMSPVDTAVWWTEYVLRHKNTSSMKSVVRNQTWYESRLLDVWITVFLALQISFGAIAFIIFKLFKFLTGSTNESELKKSNTKKKQ